MKNALAGVERTLFWTLAAAVFAAVTAGLAARAVDRLAAGYEEDRQGYAIVRVLAPEGPYAIAAAQVALSDAPHIASAAPMTRGRATALLREWGGGEASAEDLPELRLVEVELEPASPGADVAGDIVASLAQAGVTAEVIEAPREGSGGGLSERVRNVAAWGAIAFAVMMTVIVMLVARGLAVRRREYVTVLCDLGATRGEVEGRIGDEATMLGLYAGLVGGVLAGLAALVILMLAVPDLSIQSLPAMILPLDFVPIAAAPIVAALAAGLGARAAAGYFHGKAARLG